MPLSARNQLKGRIKSIQSDNVMSEVVIDVGGMEICSTITANSVTRLGLKIGDEASAIIKASDVIISK
ncbi:MAG: TOBE domain-containing protein [Syntrophomonadaceae bacterium]|jgi:molybdopterin-binding protein